MPGLAALARTINPPPTLAGFDSSDDDDGPADDDDDASSTQPSTSEATTPAGGGSDGGGGGGGGGGGASLAPALDPLSRSSVQLSQSGAFTTADFQIRAQGGLRPIGESSAEEEVSYPEELGLAQLEYAVAPTVEVRSLEELEMLSQLGAGASGTVHKARHRDSGTLVAVKAVTILEKTKRDQVVAEVRIMRKHTLGAKWLVAMYNAFYEDAKVYTVLELMEGGSVEGLISRNPHGVRDEALLITISRQLLEGLNYLHRQLHQVHRDLKPANVLLDAAGDVRGAARPTPRAAASDGPPMGRSPPCAAHARRTRTSATGAAALARIAFGRSRLPTLASRRSSRTRRRSARRL
jgi:hypothetical protein